MDAHFPLNIDFLNGLWPAGGPQLTAAVGARLGEPTSYNASLWRVQLTWDRLAPERPSSLIAKLPTRDLELTARAATFQPGARENWFYGLLERHPAGSIPRCYYNAVDAGTHQSILLLADLAPAVPANQYDGLTVAQAAAALAALARQQAYWWNRPDHPDIRALKALLGPAMPDEVLLVQQLYDDAWPRFLAADLVDLPEPVRRYGAAFVGAIPRADAMLDRPQKTLVHGDFRADNLLFREESGRVSCYIVDWEDIHWGTGLLDVAWLLGSCLPLTDVDQEMALLRHYHHELGQAGVVDYPFAECLLDYRLALSNTFIQGVLSAMTALAKGSAGRSLAERLAQRISAAARRHDLVAFI